ncbi:lysophospholipid acyltransferase family protein, partial [Xanthovirga aplysinae]|uniref:lysophospholipid acyltransferase family protein n=1 Tax=Xanthovirga aplysinae TaxID=2529853 RepID=UPI0012BC99C0
LIIKSFGILGARVTFRGLDQLPNDRPLIIVANHQSMYDIPAVVWGFRKHHPKFVAKKELGKNIPSASYSLKHGGSVLIDRKNGSQSIREIIKLGKKIEKNSYSACIFPEGTRSKNGQLRKFQAAGIRTLLKGAPSALIVPYVIDGNFRLQINGHFPMSFGEKLNYTALKPIEPKGMSAEEVVEKTEIAIREALSQKELVIQD